MRDEEIRRRIASFPRWHYRFDLNGNLTPVSGEKTAERHEQRKRYFFDPLVELFGGSLAGKRVLDLGCNAGFWSLNAARAGCDYVLGIDGRQMHVDQAGLVFEVEEVEQGRYDFIAGDLFELDFRDFGRFDVVLCLGLMYHVSKHMELMEKISAVNDDVLLVDTIMSTLPGSCFEVRHDRMEDPRNAVDRALVMAPSWQAVHDLAREFGYGVGALKPHFGDHSFAPEYRRRRRAFLCAKQTDVSGVPAEIEDAPPAGPAAPPTGRGAGAAGLERRMLEVDRALSELMASRRWKLAKVLGETSRRVLGKARGPTAEDRLVALQEELRASSEGPGRTGQRGRGHTGEEEKAAGVDEGPGGGARRGPTF